MPRHAPIPALLTLAGLLVLPTASRAVSLGFDAQTYTVAPGQPLTVQVVIDHEGRAPENLFSYGVRLLPSGPGTATVSSIIVPDELDFDGFSAGAQIDTDPAVLGAKGNINLAADFYTGSLIATYTISFDQPGVYDLGLALYRTLGPDEDVFVDGSEEPVTLDELMTFGSARVVVIGQNPDVAMTVTPPVPPSLKVDVAFDTIDGVLHTLETSTTLAPGTWEPLVTITGDGARFEFEHFGGGAGGRRFYRVSLDLGSG